MQNLDLNKEELLCLKIFEQITPKGIEKCKACIRDAWEAGKLIDERLNKNP